MSVRTVGGADGPGGLRKLAPQVVATLSPGSVPRLAGAPLVSPPFPKILFYSHDTFGLGNIRRTLLLAHELAEQYPAAAILIVTGSPMIHAFRIPERIDYIKLPSLDRIDADRYQPRFLSACAEEVNRTRRDILVRAIVGFEPDLFIVDKRPGGIDGELLDALRLLRRSRRATRIVLGVRDILDEPERTQRSLKKSRFFETIDHYYDEVWIYGSPRLFDAVKEYGFPASVALKTRFCGYLVKRPPAALPRDEPAEVLVTPGGGGDGGPMIAAYLEGLAGLPRRMPLRSTVVFGPEMPASSREALRDRFGFLTDVTFLEFDSDLSRLYQAADVVVAMAGYSTVCELLSWGRLAVLVPRSRPVAEQLLRARRFARHGYFDLIEPDELTPQGLIAKVLRLRQGPPPVHDGIEVDGLRSVRERVAALLEEPAARARRGSGA